MAEIFMDIPIKKLEQTLGGLGEIERNLMFFQVELRIFSLFHSAHGPIPLELFPHKQCSLAYYLNLFEI